jgi:hypothetical protein
MKTQSNQITQYNKHSNKIKKHSEIQINQKKMNE